MSHIFIHNYLYLNMFEQEREQSTEIDAVFADILAKSTTLSECLNNKKIEINNSNSNCKNCDYKTIQIRKDNWCHIVAKGNWHKFKNRLEWDEIDLELIAPLLGEVHLPNQKVPNWVKVLKEITETALDFFHKENINNLWLTPINSENPLPFEDILLPIVLVARNQLIISLGFSEISSEYLPLQLLSESAYLSLEHELLQQLVDICGKCLEYEFSQTRHLGQNLLNLLGCQKTGKLSTENYQLFVREMLRDGLLTFFQKYPVLAKLVATKVIFWVEATAEFIQRLKSDLPKIREEFFFRKFVREEIIFDKFKYEKVAFLQSSLSDSHNRGRSVIALTFESGVKLIYKPRDIGLEDAYFQLLKWFNNQNIPLTFKIIKTLKYPGYGWVQYVEHLPCENESAAKRFYRRTGMLLCLLYVLGATDCHHENFIASGEHLLLVDMEALIQPEIRLMGLKSEINSKDILWNSVLNTGLLPYWSFNKDNSIAYDVSGLGNVSSQKAPNSRQYWKFINTDEMHLATENKKTHTTSNVAILKGKALLPNDYLDDILAGFEQMYHFLLKQRNILIGDNSPLKEFQGKQGRFIFRDTQLYSLLLEEVLAPNYLSNVYEYSIKLDILSCAFLSTQEKPYTWNILSSEIKSIEQLDIPYFTVNSNSNILELGNGQTIDGFFKKTSYKRLISNIEKLDEADLALQLEIIKVSFYSKIAHISKGHDKSISSDLMQIHLSQMHCFNSKQFLQKATYIGEEIQSRAIKGNDGIINWIDLVYVSNAKRFQLQTSNENLYHGKCGIALFLAALDKIKGGYTSFHYLALDALRSLQKFLDIPQKELLKKLTQSTGIGGATGLGSIVYALVKISQFLQEEILLEYAQRAAQLISPTINNDTNLDVIAGSAGAILGLIALYQQTGDANILNTAIICGQHLLAEQITLESGHKTWKTLEKQPLTGFSHGASGISYALLKLYEFTNDTAYLVAAKEGIIYEQSVFSKSQQNWPDFRYFNQQKGKPGFIVSWCHGAPGIGLGRLGSLQFLPSEMIRLDIEAAINTTINSGIQIMDHCCCGNFGLLETLLVASQKLSRPDLLETARKKANLIIERAERNGGFQLFPNLTENLYSPSFFQGTAGIGYTLLRLANPTSLPSILLWE